MPTFGDINQVIPNSQFSQSRAINSQIYKILQELEQNLAVYLAIRNIIQIDPSAVVNRGKALRDILNKSIDNGEILLHTISTQFGSTDDVGPLFTNAKIQLECVIEISAKMLKYLSGTQASVYEGFNTFSGALNNVIDMNYETLLHLHNQVCCFEN